MTSVEAVDQGFVATPPGPVFRVLTDVPSYPSWWPGTEVRSLEGRFRVRLPGGPMVPAVAGGHREGVGLTIRLDPPYSGTLEWYLEPFEEGTVVSSILHLDLPGGPRRSARGLRRLRAGVHGGLLALRNHLG